jgi:CBS domain-containing protein
MGSPGHHPDLFQQDSVSIDNIQKILRSALRMRWKQFTQDAVVRRVGSGNGASSNERYLVMGLRMGLVCDKIAALRLRDAIRVTPATTVRNAVSLMKSHGIGCVFVTDANDSPQGIFTEAHLLRLLATDRGALGDPVSRHYSHPVYCLPESESIDRLINLMQSKDLRFVGVTDDAGRLIGVTGQKGLMEYVAEHYPSQVLVARTGAHRCLQREGA